jgi:HEAT repeat protein
LERGTPRRQWGAIRALALLGEAAAPALPHLRRLARSADVRLREEARRAVVEVEVGLLVTKLRCGNQDERGEAVAALGRFLADAGSVVPRLVELLGHQEEAVRMAAVEALMPFGHLAGQAVPALEKAWRRGGQRFRRVVMAAIKALQPPGEKRSGVTGPGQGTGRLPQGPKGRPPGKP